MASLELLDFQYPHFDAQATETLADKRSLFFAVWPAICDDHHIPVFISTRELSDFDGTKFGISSEKIRGALLRNWDIIQTSARKKHVAGQISVILDIGDLWAV